VSNVNLLLTTCGLVLATFLTRVGLLVAGQRFKPSPRIEMALRYAPICALAALIAPEVLAQGGAVDISFANPRFSAALAATVFFVWKRSMLGCIVVGMLVLTALRLGSIG
jgi:branched-subunit amino acid transport protein